MGLLQLRTGDKIILIIVIVSLVCGISLRILFANGSSKIVLIMVDGKLFEEIPLSVNAGHNEDILVESKEGYLSVEISNGKVRVTDSTCKDKLCIKEGEISKVGDTIICLPNRISISIIGENSNIDTVSY